jgi:hypothetical protein
MFTQLNNQISAAVLDKNGRKIDEREFVNTPFTHLFPEDEFVVIDWLANNTIERPEEDELTQPVTYDGKEWHGSWAWGSAVKTGQTVGLLHDIGHECQMIKNAEDGQRFNRWLLAQGLWGGISGDLKIGIAKPGTVVNGMPIEDGFGYIRREVAEAGYNGLNKIKLGQAKESYTFWQHIPWGKIAEEVSPIIRETMVDLADVSKVLMDYSPGTFDDKKALYEAENRMLEHPFVANAIARASGEMLARAATTVYTGAVTRVAVPTTAKQVALNRSGKHVIYRYPIDNWGSIQAVDVRANKEAERIANLEVVQYTLASKEFFAKGCLGIVDDLPYDIILCSDDIKMVSGDLKEFRKQKEALVSGVMAFTQWFDKGSAIGVNAKWAKDLMGLDHDGDLVVLVDCGAFPKLWEAVSHFPKAETPKLVKTKSPIGISDAQHRGEDKRPEMIRKSMMNLVGYASNLMTETFMVTDREWLAHQLGFKSEAGMDERLNYFVKVGTDGFKTNVDQEPVRKHMGILQQKMLKMFGVMAPWTSWPNDWAFTRGIPEVGGEDKEAVKPFMTGTIPQIARLTLPNLKAVLETPIKVRPLTAFRMWAMPVDSVQYECAKVLQEWYNARSMRVNWSDPDAVGKFKTLFVQEAKTWMEREGLDERIAASALWRVAHSSRSSNAGAASVFIAFPEASRWIVAEKPGLKSTGLATILTGCNYQVPGLEELEAEVEVVDVTTEKNGKQWVRKAICGAVEGQLPPQSDLYPENMIGLVAVNADQPEKGAYFARIKKVSSGAWKCVLVGA